MVCHGDDIAADTFEAWGDRFPDRLGEHFKVSSKAKLGPLTHRDKEGRLLNRLITWTDEGLQVESGPRHVELVVLTLASQCELYRHTVEAQPESKS